MNGVLRDVGVRPAMHIDYTLVTVVHVNAAAIEVGEIVVGNQLPIDADRADNMLARGVGGGVPDIDLVGALSPDEVAAKPCRERRRAILHQRAGVATIASEGVTQLEERTVAAG